MPAIAADFARKRQTMVECQIRTFDVTDQPLLQRFLDVPREIFVGAENQASAYSDSLLKVRGRAMLRPLILARLLQAARLEAGQRALIVGAATGYTAALAAGLADEVVAIESDAGLADAARANLAQLGLGNVEVQTGALDAGAKTNVGFNVIVVDGAIEDAPATLLAQLAEGGRLVAILRDGEDPTGQAAKAVIYERTAGKYGHRPLFSAFASPVLPGFARAAEFTF